MATLPEGYMWVEELAHLAKQDIKSLIWLCENEYMQAVRYDDRWAVRVIRKTAPQAGTAIVRDLRAGGNITIGQIVGQYVTIDDKKDHSRDHEERIAQTPIRYRIDHARQWIRWTWLILASGSVFALIGIVLSWPVASLMCIPAWERADKALDMAKTHGDKALLEEAQHIRNQARITTILLWGVMLCVILVSLLFLY